jgi:hypothetical protein
MNALASALDAVRLAAEDWLGRFDESTVLLAGGLVIVGLIAWAFKRR